MHINELIENFEFFEDWEDKYRYIIELGEKLPALDEKFKTDEWKVEGCQSQVWLVPHIKDGIITFAGDSDAMIVRGLMAIIFEIFSNKSAKEINDIDVDAIMVKMGLNEHLSPSRRNGLKAMIDRIKRFNEYS